MPVDTVTPGSPGWYLQRLADKLSDRRARIDLLFARYEGNAPVPSSLIGAPETARRFFLASRTSFAEMIVKAVKYPLKVQSVLTEADQSDTGDSQAWRLFLRSGMATEVDDVHRVSLVAGDAYAIVNTYQDVPRYTAEDPRQVVTIHDPVVQSLVVAAGKFFHHSEDGVNYAYLYRDGRAWRAFQEERLDGVIRFDGTAWDWDEEFGGEDGVPLPPGAGVLRYRNEEGVGEFERHTDLLDRLDHMILQGMTIATLQAFKQRAIKVDPRDMPDEDPDTGEQIDYDHILESGPDALWKLPATADIWESGNVDLTPVWTGVDKFIQQLSAVTFTPLAMFSPEGQNQSAAGAGFAREGRTFKIEDRQSRLGLVHAEALARLAQLAGDDARSDPASVEIVWRPAERYSLAEKADALVKVKAGDVTWRTRMIEVMQFTPAQVRRMEAERMDDALLFPATVTATAADTQALAQAAPVAEPV